MERKLLVGLYLSLEIAHMIDTVNVFLYWFPKEKGKLPIPYTDSESIIRNESNAGTNKP
jgi:hypothetical protein